MIYDYEKKDGSLVFKDLSIGNLITGEKLTWDELRQVVVLATRFGQKRPLKDRTLEELTEDLKSFIDDKVQREGESDRDLNNLKVQMGAQSETIEWQNRKYTELKDAYNELNRAFQELQKKA